MQMERKASNARSDLEQMLVDETADPKALPLSLLEDITGGFSEDQEIGSGGFAVVYKGILGDRAVAVKRLSNAFMDETEFHREVECLMRVKHKNVVRFLGYCADRQGNMERYDRKLVMADVHQRLLCFEYIPKGSLDKYIIDAYREWGTCYKIIKGICEGLQYLHDNHIIHLDLKPANILLDDNMLPKITDFGLSRCFDENQSRDITKTILGTMGYLAPELCEGGVISRTADLYSLGVIIIEILTGQKGYQATEDVLESWSGRLERSQRDTLCDQIRECYETTLECRDFNPKKRPARARDIIDRLHEMENTQHTNTIPAQQQDHLRFQAVQMVAKRLERAEPPLRREVVECILDPDSHMFSLRRSKANFYRVTSLFSSTVAVAKWFDGIRKWNNPLTTILVHVLFLVLVRYGDAQLILPMVFLCMVIIGAWNYPRRPREPPHIDTVLSHAELAHPDELDEEFDTLPPPYMDTELWYPDQAHPNDEFNFNTSKPDAILRMRYDRLRSVGGRLQAVGFDLATQGERAQSLLSWNDPRVTPIFMTLSLVVTVVLYLTPSRVVTAAAVLYLLRHPWFRSEQPSMLRTFFRRLHAKDDVLL